MEREKQKKVVGTVSLEEALNAFANISEENKKLLERVEKINELIDTVTYERMLQGLSQRDLAELTGIKQPMIARFEKAEMMPRIDTFIKIASCLNLDIKIVYKNEYSKLNLNEEFDYNNKYEGEEIYGFGRTKDYEYGYQA